MDFDELKWQNAPQAHPEKGIFFRIYKQNQGN